METINIRVRMDVKAALLAGYVVGEWEEFRVSAETVGQHWPLLVNSLVRERDQWILRHLAFKVGDRENTRTLPWLLAPKHEALIAALNEQVALHARDQQQAVREIEEALQDLENIPLEIRTYMDQGVQRTRSSLRGYDLLSRTGPVIHHKGLWVQLPAVLVEAIPALLARNSRLSEEFNAPQDAQWAAKREEVVAQQKKDAEALVLAEQRREQEIRALRERTVSENLTLADIVRLRRARKGKPTASNAGGSFWEVVRVRLRRYGGEGVGNSSPDLTDYFVVRHYRDHSLAAVVETHSWHQNSGKSVEVQAVPETLQARTIEDLVVCLKVAEFRVGGQAVAELVEALPELPEASPSPDDEPAAT